MFILAQAKSRTFFFSLSSSPLHGSACLQKPTETQQLCLAILTVLRWFFDIFDIVWLLILILFWHRYWYCFILFHFVSFFLRSAPPPPGGPTRAAGSPARPRWPAEWRRPRWRWTKCTWGLRKGLRWTKNWKGLFGVFWGSSWGLGGERRSTLLNWSSNMLQQPIPSKSTFS